MRGLCTQHKAGLSNVIAHLLQVDNCLQGQVLSGGLLWRWEEEDYSIYDKGLERCDKSLLVVAAVL